MAALVLHRVRPYGVALLAAVLAVMVRRLLAPVAGPILPYLVFLPAVVVAAWSGGLGPGLLAAFLTTLAGPAHPLSPSPPDVLAQLLFFLQGAALSGFSEALRRTRRRAEANADRLRQSEERRRVILSSIGDGVILTDEVGRVTFLNPVAQLLTGWGPEEAAGQPLGKVFAIFHRDTGEPVEDPVARVLRDHTVVGLGNHTLLRGRDGKERPIDDSAAPLRDEQGQTLGVVLVFRDATERRQAEEALREREAALRQFYDSAPVMMGLVELLPDDVLHLSDNAATARFFGLNPEALRHRRASELGSQPEPLRRWLAAYREAERTGRPVRFEYLHPTAAGRRWLSAAVSLVSRKTDGRARFCYVAEDATERRRAAEALREQARALAQAQQQSAEALAQLDSLLRHAPIGFAFFDRDYRYVRINPFLAAINGVPVEEHLGRTLRDVLPVNADTLEPVLEQVFRTGQPVLDLEVSGETPAAPGVRRHWWTGFYPVRSAQSGENAGPPSWVGVVVLEITDRKHMEAELRRQAEELAENDRRKDAFLAMLGHELRNPLAPIRNALHILDLHPAEDPVVVQMLEMIDRQVGQLARLVDDLLDMSRINRGLIELRKELVDLGAVVERAVESTRPLLEERRHQLTATLPPSSVRLEADPARLEQVLANLLNNAAKYTEEGGRIDLIAERADGEVVVRVRDTGIGIRPEMLSAIFDLFQQGDQVRGRVSEGLGLGLTLVRSLVELHGGWVRALSPGPGQGSTFEVHLPAQPPLPSAAQGEEPAALAAKAPPVRKTERAALRILVVDDNVDAAYSLSLLFRLFGHEVRVTHDGQAALAAAPDYRPDVAFLDIGLPGGMDGYEVARHLRTEPSLAGTVLVALTGYGQQEDRQHSLQAGFAAHLVKPVEADQLREVLDQVRPDRRPGADREK